MAIQAQYTSPVLFLNRDQQERKNTEYPFQAPAAALLDQSALLFPTQPSNNEGGSGTNRKRRREAAAAATVPATTTNYPIDVFSLQQQHPNPSNLNTIATPTTMNTTLIDLSLLRNQQPPASTFVSTGLRLSFEDTQQTNRPNQLQQQQQQRQLGQRNSFLSALMAEELAILVKQQSDEINIYLQAQAEQLQQTLAESRRRHYKALLELAEQSAAKRLREKDVEMEHAARRHAELEKRIVQLRAEAASWQTKARAEEATAAALQAQLQQTARERHLKGTAGEAGCSGVADQPTAEAEDAESAYVDPERQEGAAVGETPGGVSTAMACRVCQRRVVSVLLLPCRHLCLCRHCAAGVGACPICLCARTACLQVFLS